MIDLLAYLQYRLTQSITRYKRCVDCRSDSRSPRACAAVEFKRGVTARRREHGKRIVSNNASRRNYWKQLTAHSCPQFFPLWDINFSSVVSNSILISQRLNGGQWKFSINRSAAHPRELHDFLCSKVTRRSDFEISSRSAGYRGCASRSVMPRTANRPYTLRKP